MRWEVEEGVEEETEEEEEGREDEREDDSLLVSLPFFSWDDG